MNVATILENYSISPEYNNAILSFHINDGRLSTTSHRYQIIHGYLSNINDLIEKEDQQLAPQPGVSH